MAQRATHNIDAKLTACTPELPCPSSNTTNLNLTLQQHSSGKSSSVARPWACLWISMPRPRQRNRRKFLRADNEDFGIAQNYDASMGHLTRTKRAHSAGLLQKHLLCRRLRPPRCTCKLLHDFGRGGGCSRFNDALKHGVLGS